MVVMVPLVLCYDYRLTCSWNIRGIFRKYRHPLGARVGTSEGLTRRVQGETRRGQEERTDRDRETQEEDSERERLEELS